MSLTGHSTITPARLAENVERRMNAGKPGISAFWLPVLSNRTEYAGELGTLFSDSPVCTFIVRDISFENPNAMMNDLVRVLDENRGVAEEAYGVADQQNFGIVLLARAPLSVPQASSPVVMPDWFPAVGGTTVSVVIEDLSWTADGPLNAPEARVDALCERLCELDGSLVRRLAAVQRSLPAETTRLAELIGRDGDGPFGDLLDQFANARKRIISPSAFRPSLRDGSSLTSRLWALGHQRNPEEHAPGKALASALRLSETSSRAADSFATLIRRPSSPVSHSTAIARNVLGTVSSTAQLITAAAHADSYGRYPISLLTAYSFDLRRSMQQIEFAIDMLPDP